MFEKYQNKLMVSGVEPHLRLFAYDHPHLPLIRTEGIALCSRGTVSSLDTNFKTLHAHAGEPTIAVSKLYPELTFAVCWLGANGFGIEQISNGTVRTLQNEVIETNKDYTYNSDKEEIVEILHPGLSVHFYRHGFQRSTR